MSDDKNKIVTRNIHWPIWLRDQVNEISKGEQMPANLFIIQAIKEKLERYEKRQRKESSKGGDEE